MERRCVSAVALTLCLLLAGSSLAGAQEEADPGDVVKRTTDRVSAQAGETVHAFAQHADTFFEGTAESSVTGWGGLGVCVIVGGLALFFGWTFVQSLLVPSAPVLGLATGGFTAFCIIEYIYSGGNQWFRLALVALGATVGVGLYLFSALKAKPVAAFLVILSPFLILALFLFPVSELLGLVVFFAGFLAGFLAMVEARPLSIVATSLLGSLLLVSAWGMLSHLISEEGHFVRDSFVWLTNNPLMLALGLGGVGVIGVLFQFATGPRGSLQQ